MKKSTLVLCLALCAPSFAESTNFLDQIEEKGARFTTLSASMLFDIQDAESGQVEALKLYTSEVGKQSTTFGQLLQKASTLIEQMRGAPQQKTITEFQDVIRQMDSVIVQMKNLRVKIAKTTENE